MNMQAPQLFRFTLVMTILIAAIFAAAWPALTLASQLTGVEQGLPLPPGISFVAVKGTGQTTGHIADLTVRNVTDEEIEFPGLKFFIPSDGRYQSYVGETAPGHTVPAGGIMAVPLQGYCATVRRPPVPAGEDMPPPEAWVVSTGQDVNIAIPPGAAPSLPGNALIPGTDTPLPRAVSLDEEPELAAPLLLAAIAEIERAADELQESGALVTPFSGNPEREREAVVQQTLWIFAAELENEPYTKEEFSSRLEAQYEASTGVAVVDAADEDREQLQQGADDFWGAFELVGIEAKVINVSSGASAGAGAATGTEQDPLGAKAEGQPAAPAAPPACTVEVNTPHSDPMVKVQIGENYGNVEERETITKGIRESVESEESAYATSTPPSTAYSIWRQDHIGGISSGYAKVVFLEDNEQEWVWSTEELKTTASGNGVHTITFTHGPECTSVVAGSAVMWLRGTSEAFDPLERSIEYFRALDAVKEITVKYLADKLPPGLDEGLEAGVEAITDPSSDTYAAASGTATLVVGGNRDSKTAANRVVYKREGKEDKAIIGGGATVQKVKVSDKRPKTLTSRIDASVTMEAGAQGNGFAKAYLESLYGTILIGVCECPNAPPLYEVLTDQSQFIRTDAAKAVVERATGEMKNAADLIGKAIELGNQETDGEALEKRAAAELEKWGKAVAGDRFEGDAVTASN